MHRNDLPRRACVAARIASRPGSRKRIIGVTTTGRSLGRGFRQCHDRVCIAIVRCSRRRRRRNARTFNSSIGGHTAEGRRRRVNDRDRLRTAAGIAREIRRRPRASERVIKMTAT